MMPIKINVARCILPSIVIGVISLLPQKVLAETASLSQAMQQCATLADDKQKLSCFEKLTKTLTPAITKDTTAKKSTKVTTTVVSSELKQEKVATAEQVDDFAKEFMKKSPEQKAQQITSITLTIAKLKKLIRGEWLINFKNGQKWQQKDDKNIRLAVGDKVILKKGALSAIYLNKVGVGASKRIRVKRLK